MVELIQLVAKYRPQQIPVFMKYMNSAFSLEIWESKMIEDNFKVMCDLMTTLALEGLLEEDQFSRKFLMLLEEKLSLAERQDRLDMALHQRLIQVVWSLVYMDMIVDKRSLAPRQLSNPLIAPLLVYLHNYTRPDPLTNLEFLQLYQIGHWIDD